MIKIHYFDASVLAKLYLEEPGSDEARKIFKESTVQRTTSLCVAESLGILKCRLFKKKEYEKYLDTTLDLVAAITNSTLRIDEQSLFNRELFDKAQKIIETNKKVDLADVFQIISIEESFYKQQGMPCVLVTADKELYNLAIERGLESILIK